MFYGTATFDMQDLDLEGNWKKCKDWFQDINDSAQLTRDIRMRFCVSHFTCLDIDFEEEGESVKPVFEVATEDPEDTHKCLAVWKWAKVQHLVNALVEKAGGSGFTGENFIELGNLMMMGRAPYCCKERFDSDDELDERLAED